MAAPPFKVKAVFEYNSPHEDDLSFPNGQIINVTEEEDADWYVGEYDDANGTHHSGLFPKNFVEKYEPEVPSRPTRPSRPKGAVQPVVSPPPASDDVEDETAQDAAPAPVPAAKEDVSTTLEPPASTPAATAPAPAIPEKSEPSAPQTTEAKASAPATPSKGPPPAVSEKPSSFKDRIAAFNKTQSSPVAPIKPSTGASNYAIKKPFVAPPPARSAYIPPVQKQEPIQKVYRREEDPEIAERLVQDQAAAEAVGLGASQPEPTEEGEDAPKPQSLKERIAALQKQQAEQAQRRADVSTKEKPRRPPKKRTESSDAIPAEGADVEEAEQAMPTRASEDSTGQPLSRSSTRAMPSVPLAPNLTQEPDILSDGNEADQSAAGEMTEGNEDTSDQEDKLPRRAPSDAVRPPRAAAAPSQEPDVGDEEGSTEGQSEEDEMDAEARRKLELRERMAKISGGMGMAGMFGPQPGMAIAPPASRKSTKSRERRQSEDKPSSPPAPRPMIPVPGMLPQRPKVQDEPEVETDEEDAPSTSVTRGVDPAEVQDVEDIKPKTVLQEPKNDVPGARAAPPVPGSRPVPVPPPTTSRPPPPALPPQLDEHDDSEATLPDRPLVETPRAETQYTRAAPPPVPSTRTSVDSTRSPPIPGASTTASYFPNDAASEASIPVSTERRASRAAPPPIPTAGGLASPSLHGRAAPPPPPSAPAPSKDDAVERESEYEGDYDTDIASGDKHKAALKSVGRRHSGDESTTTDDQSTPEPPTIPAASPPSTHRAVPPPPPPSAAPLSHAASSDMSRGMPPPLPQSRAALATEESDEAEDADDADDGLDNYRRYHETRRPPPAAPVAAAAPPPPPSRAPADDSEDELYAVPTRKSMEPTRAVPPPPPSEPSPRIPEGGRKSLDANRALGRKSTEGGRPIGDDFIATDIDPGVETAWWAQPNTLPPSLQNRADIRTEVEESTSSKRGGKSTVSKDIYVLYYDYSQTVLTATFSPSDHTDATVDQRHEPPPSRPRQDQLESAWQSYGARIAERATALASGKKETSPVGDGTAHALAAELIAALPAALGPVGSRSYGAAVYANIGNASVQQYDEIRPGDLITFRNAKLQGKHGGLHQRYSQDVGGQGQGHVAIVLEWDGTKKKVRAVEQGKDEKGRVKVRGESYRLGDLKSGEVKVWRVVGREWVGWGDGK